MVIDPPTARKPAEFVAGARAELRAMPKRVRFDFGYAILLAQCGEKHPDAKPLKGYGGAGVLEVVENFDRDTYRCVYTVKLAGVVYVLGAFKKKAKKGKGTPKYCSHQRAFGHCARALREELRCYRGPSRFETRHLRTCQ